MLEELCLLAQCKRFVSNKCQVFNEGGRQYRIRYGYCPIPDYPPVEKAKSVWRAGQQKQVKIKKK